MNKVKAKYFYWHLAISTLIVSSISLVSIYIWFPKPFLILDGTWFAILTLAVVDIVLGPLITFVLINTKKSKLERTFDMLVIISMQGTALTYGLNQIYNERPFAIIYANSMFHQIPVKEINENYLNTKLPLPTYNFIYYGMVNETSHDLDLTYLPLLYSANNYQKLTSKILQDDNFDYDNLPNSIKKKYTKSHHFKVLAGKNRIGVVVLNHSLTIIDIVPIDDRNQYAKMSLF
ncbi:hypothetical protein GCM10009111_12510 [Colwellia asteriadis]|uniref:Type IV pilin accessory protein n=1 Tax=Colwellia asteriadis TaxID=517723 RepID=A0ABN1L5D4_9GAMM